MVSFTLGALLPLLTILLFPDDVRALVTLVAVAVALGLTGFVSARVGEAPTRPAVVRNVVRRAAGDGRDLRDRLADRHRRQLTGR